MSKSSDILKFFGVVALIGVALAVSIANIGNEQDKVEAAVRAMGYENVVASNDVFVACWGDKGRYGYKWTGYRNGQPFHGEACSGGLFQETVVKP